MADSDIHEKLFNASGKDGDDTRVRELLTAGGDPKYKDSYNGQTALYKAAWWGRDSIVSILIQHGADLNIQTNYGRTALYLSAGSGHNEVTTTLIEAGANLNIQNNEGKTPIQVANEEIARLE